MASELLLPLFPLEVVLLPDARLPLHIFEERYKLMVGEAIDRRSEFGIVLAKENSLANLGCTATVEQIVRRYRDGRLDIVARGRRRFEILFLDEEKPYLRAAVQFFDDEERSAVAGEAVDRMHSLLDQAVALLPDLSKNRPAAGGKLDSFQIAGLLPLELDFKQQMLSLRSEAGRVEILTGFLEKLLPRLQHAQKVERLARGNGRGR